MKRSVGLLACLAAPAFAGDAPAALGVCVVDQNPPFSSRSAAPAGVDVDVAQAVAARLGRTVSWHWITMQERGGLGRALKESVQAGQCELFAGMPVTEGADDELSTRGLAASQPYVSVGYVLLTPASSPVRSMSDVRKLKIGAVTATPADLYLLEGNFNRTPFANGSALLGALAGGQLGAGLLWAGRVAGEDLPSGVVVREVLQASELQTRFVMLSRRSDAALTSAVDAAIGALRADGTLAAIATRNGLPTGIGQGGN
ncbi:MAG: transporter substrate-binding domain-containing protein [Gammaproteobacteria bacterium]|jgi:polar amino acid transport system substrate-binding protein|nr:transporter substrate-binding domain-containing protein [Gammaproteobacteria bacterium]MBU0770093.1 transporter substrate-binding domain-containing protein [Gammaproteobacteria bacterium]MBU0855312.1 transporter substrate-binding domain-containing protein [Gammaproteobacteria bacterium]MBU1845880.1 transporter substrate-binding domain-containing protein [Gammaproteobacteria bacterium]